MPIPDWSEPESESPEMDTRMLEFVERRREEHARARRQRIQLVAIIALGLIALVLTVSNAVLVSRLVARPVTPPAVAPPPARPAPPASAAEPATAAAPDREAASPAAAVRSEPPVPSPPRVSRMAPPAPADEAPALPERPARVTSRPAPVPASRPSTQPESLSPAVETDPAVRTARWMIRTYGPLEAEGKALAAAQFYGGGEGEFWRRVVAHVRAER